MDDLEVLNKLLQDTTTAQESLRDAVTAKQRVENAVTAVKGSKSKANTGESDAAFMTALTSAKEAASEIYANKVKNAAISSVEYAYDAFLLPLIEVGNNKELYSITTLGAGWSRSISVELMMNDIAGELDDYAEAVELVRGSLGVKEDRDGSKASKYWRTKVYPDTDGRYNLTIDLRLSAASSPAPFWSLLNDGSKNVHMSSDIDGGRAYPSRGGHHFVEQTERAIKSYFLSEFRKLRAATQDTTDVKEPLIEADKLLNKLQQQIDKMVSNSELMKALAKDIGVTVKQLNTCKVLALADRVKNGLPLTDKVTVGNSIRVRKGKFSNIVNSFGE